MLWFTLVLISILFFSIEALLNRVLMKNQKSDPYTQTFLLTCFMGVWILIIKILNGGFVWDITASQIPYILFVSLLATLGGICTFSGYKYIEASEHTILLTSSRLWVMIGAIIILGETLSFQNFLGSALIITGVVITIWKKQKIIINKGVLFVLGAAFFYAFGEIVSFYTVRSMNTISFMMSTLMISIIMMFIVRPKTVQRLSFYKKQRNLLNVIIVSLLDTIANLFLLFAYQQGRNALQIGPIMAFQTILTVLLASVLLQERTGLLRKIFGAMMGVAGTILLLR